MMIHLTLSAFLLLLATAGFASTEGLAPRQKIEMVRELLKSLETKDPKPPATSIPGSIFNIICGSEMDPRV